MKDADCCGFLQWALPQLGLCWSGYRKVRRQVCKRVDRRLHALGLPDVAAYRRRLESHPGEWLRLESMCAIPISRFYRDRSVFEALECQVLPALAAMAIARGDGRLRCWTAGSASGEEPYSLAILWQLALADRYPQLELRVLATDNSPQLLERARIGCYGRGSVKALPPKWLEQAFELSHSRYCIREQFRRAVEFERQDLRAVTPEEEFDLVLCRNLAFTYFAPGDRQRTLERLGTTLKPGGALVIGLHERLPSEVSWLSPWPETRAIFRHDAGRSAQEAGA